MEVLFIGSINLNSYLTLDDMQLCIFVAKKSLVKTLHFKLLNFDYHEELIYNILAVTKKCYCHIIIVWALF